MNDEELSREESDALRALKLTSRDDFPPPRIEDALVDALKRDGRIASRRRWLPVLVAGAAAAALAFAAGLSVPRESSRPSAPAGPRFAILLYTGEIPPDAPRRHDEYAAWARQVALAGTSISGEELLDEGSDPAGPRGFFIITARDADQARAIAATCPHVKYGGRVVVRKIA